MTSERNLISPKYHVGDVVLVRTRAPGGLHDWTRGVIKDVTMKFAGKQSQAMYSPKGHEIFEGRVLGPLYWVAVDGSRLHESPKWEYELKDMEQVP